MHKPKYFDEIHEHGVDLAAIVESVQIAKRKAAIKYQTHPVAVFIPTWLQAPIDLAVARFGDHNELRKYAGTKFVGPLMYDVSGSIAAIPLVFTNDVDQASVIMTNDGPDQERLTVNVSPIEIRPLTVLI